MWQNKQLCMVQTMEKQRRRHRISCPKRQERFLRRLGIVTSRWQLLKQQYKKNKELANAPITRENTPNKYVYALMFLIQLRFIWDIETLFSKYLPMQRIYQAIGYAVFWLLWFIFIMVIIYNVVGSENFLAVLEALA